MSKSRLVRYSHIAEKIVFLDGISGTGKTMMGPLLASFERVELGRFDYIHEYLCALDFLEKIDPDAAEFMMDMYADLSLYHSMISRETNFRFTDLSGVFRNPWPLRYLWRLFLKDGARVLDRIKTERPIPQFISHQSLGIMALAFRTFSQRLRILEMVRHPLYLLEHWYTYIDRFGTDPRDFTVWIEHKGKVFPWFAKGWEDKYLASPSFDRVIYSLNWLFHKADEAISVLSDEEKKQILVIPFEHFVLGPDPFLEQIEKLLGTKMTRATRRVLKAQKCPRVQVAAGPVKEIYKRYGWKRPELGSSELAELENKRKFARELASKDAMKTLDVLCKEYESKYGLWF